MNPSLYYPCIVGMGKLKVEKRQLVQQNTSYTDVALKFNNLLVSTLKCVTWLLSGNGNLLKVQKFGLNQKQHFSQLKPLVPGTGEHSQVPSMWFSSLFSALSSKAHQSCWILLKYSLSAHHSEWSSCCQVRVCQRIMHPSPSPKDLSHPITETQRRQIDWGKVSWGCDLM